MLSPLLLIQLSKLQLPIWQTYVPAFALRYCCVIIIFFDFREKFSISVKIYKNSDISDKGLTFRTTRDVSFVIVLYNLLFFPFKIVPFIWGGNHQKYIMLRLNVEYIFDFEKFTLKCVRYAFALSSQYCFTYLIALVLFGTGISADNLKCAGVTKWKEMGWNLMARL